MPYLAATANAQLQEMEPPAWDKRFTVGVVGAAEGYPGSYAKGARIEGLSEAEEVEDVVVLMQTEARTTQPESLRYTNCYF